MSSVARRVAGLLCVSGLAIAAAPAAAHTGAESGHSFLAGFAHPLLGWDHLLAMVAMGLWAGTAARRTAVGRGAWAWPLSFLSGMTLGGALGFAGLALPAMEAVILASVLGLGLATLFAARPPVWLAAVAVVLLGAAHGNAHGLEAPASGSGLLYALGFLLATAALHAAGLGAALLSRRQGAIWIARALGLGVALGGFAIALN